MRRDATPRIQRPLGAEADAYGGAHVDKLAARAELRSIGRGTPPP
jgi:hypothetical protein